MKEMKRLVCMMLIVLAGVFCVFGLTEFFVLNMKLDRDSAYLYSMGMLCVLYVAEAVLFYDLGKEDGRVESR